MKINAIEAGKWGMMTAEQNLARHAEQVSRFGIDEEDLATPVVALKLDSIRFKAAATAVRAADQMQKEALDLLA